MRLDTSQQMQTGLRLQLAPRMIQSMEILQLPIMALQERIEQELIENPLLVEVSESPAADPDTDTAPEPAQTAAETEPDEFESLIGLDENWSELYEEGPRRSRAALGEESDRKLEAMQNLASRPRSFHDDLIDQLSFLDTDPLIREVAEYIINNLDERGFFRLDLHEVARDFNGRIKLDQVEEALGLVQRLDPPGIGARDLRECLLLQLTPDIPCHDLLHTLISNHLEDLEHNRLPLIEKKTGVPIERIKEALTHLGRLNLRPAASFEAEEPQYVVPDLIATPIEDGSYDVQLVDQNTPKLAISQRYQRYLRDRSTDPGTREYIQKRIQSARWLIESIEQRRTTLLKVARAIVEHQKAFLDNGPESFEPLKMQQIAEKVGVHVTTVSRAVDDKWIQTPRGNFPLKRFFGGGTTTAAGEELAWDIVKQKLLEVIAREDKQNPLSDDEIVEAMQAQGITVARRTITKYRQALSIPSSRQRKQF